MSLPPGARLGPYEITAPLGVGGMGEVYRARDTKLNRDVALKVLPDGFASDPERLARFTREAQMLASLNHPNIAAIYGLEDSTNVRALVMELVEGPTLADRIAQGAIPLDETLPIARQIAEALEAAHEQGIIHRDLKPANIKVRPDGAVKVLDFGLAKALDPSNASRAANAANSPTLTFAGATQMGVILGTAVYMSPEQAAGKAADKRSDLWAFGVVLLEMLTGRPAFTGETVSHVLASVLKSEPEWTTLPAATPTAIRRLLRRCLEKDCKRRLDSAAAARLDIEETLAAAGGATPPQASAAVPPSLWRRVAPLATGLLLGSALAGAAASLWTRPVAPRVARLTITASSADDFVLGGIDHDVALSPDGAHVVYTGRSQFHVRAMDQFEPLTFSGGARGPFISPDGAWIGYFGAGELQKVPMSGGPPLTICRCISSASRGATWGPDDTIVYAINQNTGLLRVAAGGGKPTVLTTPNPATGERGHIWPHFLPGGQAVLFTIVSNQPPQVAALDLRSGKQKTVLRGASDAQYVSGGYLVYAAPGGLRAVAFDLARSEVVGNPVAVVPQVTQLATGGGAGGADFAMAGNGTLVYVSGTASQFDARTLVWVDRQGHEEALNAPVRAYAYPRISPDGTQIALDIRDQQEDIWIWDTTRQGLTRVTFDPAQDQNPTWTPDGRRIVFNSNRGAGVYNLFWQRADGSGTPERLTQSPNGQRPHMVTPDGRWLIYREDAPKTGRDLMLLRLDDGGAASERGTPNQTRETKPLVQTTFNELDATLSPDGHWLAYQSDESGQAEIFVRPFPNVGDGRWQISTGGGTQPLWARNGEEVFYVGPTALMSVKVTHDSSFMGATPTKLFDVGGRYYLGGGPVLGHTYDVSPDGRRFLMLKESAAGSRAPQINVVLNFSEELKRLVPVR